MKNLPVILLAFANERQPGAVYLRNLPKELNQLKTILEKAEEAGLCEVEILTNVTLDQLFSTFQKKKFKDRVAVFHFSGHADSFELVIEKEDGGSKRIKAEGLVPFLAGQNGLELVFLNGCHSIGTSQQLLDQGVPVVIGTVKAVSDKTATDLSINFYRAMAEGLPVAQAWNDAINKLRAAKEDAENFYVKDEINRGGLRIENDRFPWEIKVRPGSEKARDWSLPFAANNPTFGLPEIPENYRLPETPYIFLRNFKKEEAAIFFGRGNYVRDLYRRLTNKNASPVIMLYGQSGVGKSSLLRAGLHPRMEGHYHVKLERRNSSLGLSGVLMQMLDVEIKKGLSEEEKTAKKKDLTKNIEQYKYFSATAGGDAKIDAENLIEKYQAQLAALGQPEIPDLAAAWKNKEKEKPLIIILDQVEEVFTRPKINDPNELNDFCQLIKTIFDTPENRPQGKLLLSYRKEYDSEILDALKNHRIERERLFLDKIKRADIIEIVNGLTSTERLKEKYNLEIEDGLAVEIADDLIVDPESPIAPILQIILTKLWNQQKEKDRRNFTRTGYRKLRKEGILLGDFFHQQMDVLKAWELVIQRKVESSGLALDLLNTHTTPFGTAQSNELSALMDKYQHQHDILAELIVRFKELYLLAGAGEDKVTLAHDTLAPIIQKEIRDSDRPGQRALRILENKAADYERNPDETVIEEDDLALVELGAPGMRRWSVKEIALVEKSRERRAKLQAERKRTRLFKMVATAVVAVLAVVASFFWWQSDQRRQQVEIDLKYNEGLLETNHNPTMGILKMREAFKENKDADSKMVMKGGIYDVYAKNLFYDTIHTEKNGKLIKAAFYPAGQYLAYSIDGDYNLRLIKNGNNSSTILEGPKHPINQVVFAGKYLFAAADDQTVYRWNIENSAQKVFGGHPGEGEDAVGITSVAVSKKGNIICAVEEGVPATINCYDENGNSINSFSIPKEVVHLAFFPDDELLIGLKNGWLRRINVNTGQQKEPWFTRSGNLTTMAISGNGKWVAAGFTDNLAVLWQVEKEKQDSLRDHTGAINNLAFSNDGRFLITSSEDKSSKVWTVADYRLRFTLKGHSAPVINAVFVENDQSILTASSDSTIRKWDFPYPFYKDTIMTEGSRLEGLSFNASGEKVYAIDLTGILFTYNYDGKISLDDKRILTGTENLNCMAISSENMMAIGKEGEIQFWDLNNKNKLNGGNNELSSIKMLSFNYDENKLLAVDIADNCLVLNVNNLEKINDIISFTDLPEELRHEFPPYLNLPDENGELNMPNKSTEMDIIARHAPDGDCTMNIYSGEGFLIKSFNPLPGQTKNCLSPLMTVHPEGHLVISADINGQLFIWEINRNRGGVLNF